MPRKYASTERFLKPDPVYNSRLVAKFINCLMLDGKKSTAQRVFYEAMKIVESKLRDVPPLEAFEVAIENLQPVIEVRSKRVGGATYQVPIEVKRQRQTALAFFKDRSKQVQRTLNNLRTFLAHQRRSGAVHLLQ